MKKGLIGILFIFLPFFALPLFAAPGKEIGFSKKESYSHLDSHAKRRIKPYLLPKEHPLKTTLDSLFSHPSVTKDDSSFAQAGFKTRCIRHTSYVRIAEHPSLPGFLMKLYLDSEKREKENIPGWIWLARRCEGAENLRSLIKRKKIKHFVVPDKWLYLLPWDSRLSKEKNPYQPVILIVTKMNLVSWSENVKAWKTKVTKAHLRELYCIFRHGYSSCFVTENIPYTKEGKFACIDTEHPKRNLRARYSHVLQYLSPEMKKYWKMLIQTDGNVGLK